RVEDECHSRTLREDAGTRAVRVGGHGGRRCPHRAITQRAVTPPARPRRQSTADEAHDQLLAAILARINPPRDRDELRHILMSAAGLAGDGLDRLDLKITSAALREMRAAYRAFAPYHDTP